jgi:hypothetical protein
MPDPADLAIQVPVPDGILVQAAGHIPVREAAHTRVPAVGPTEVQVEELTLVLAVDFTLAPVAVLTLVLGVARTLVLGAVLILGPAGHVTQAPVVPGMISGTDPLRIVSNVYNINRLTVPPPSEQSSRKG